MWKKYSFSKCNLTLFLILASLVFAVSCSSNDDEMGNDSKSEIEGKLIADSLVEVSSMQEWLISQINYYVNEHDMGLDIYKGAVNDVQYYMLMTVYFNTPYVYTEDGKIIEYPNHRDLLKRQNNWKRIYSYRPTKKWSDEDESTMMFWSKYN